MRRARSFSRAGSWVAEVAREERPASLGGRGALSQRRTC